MKSYDCLKLENQLCFPLYACSKEIVRRYKPFLDELDLTYTQYITMMVMWEHGTIGMKQLGEMLYLDSGTLTPLLRKLEQKGLIARIRNEEDERNVNVTITDSGMKLRKSAESVPEAVGKCIDLNQQEAIMLYGLLQKVIGGFINGQK